jgi:hypothetical protein
MMIFTRNYLAPLGADQPLDVGAKLAITAASVHGRCEQPQRAGHRQQGTGPRRGRHLLDDARDLASDRVELRVTGGRRVVVCAHRLVDREECDPDTGRGGGRKERAAAKF